MVLTTVPLTLSRRCNFSRRFSFFSLARALSLTPSIKLSKQGRGAAVASESEEEEEEEGVVGGGRGYFESGINEAQSLPVPMWDQNVVAQHQP